VSASGVAGQHVGQPHLEAAFGDRALLLEFESGCSRAVKDRRAHDTFATQRLGPSRYSAETYVEVLVAPVQGAMVWSSPPSWRWWWHPPDPVVRGLVVGMTLAAIHVPGVHTASLCTSSATSVAFDRPGQREALAACRSPDTRTSPPRDRLAGFSAGHSATLSTN
jgi:hypothetical protein